MLRIPNSMVDNVASSSNSQTTAGNVHISPLSSTTAGNHALNKISWGVHALCCSCLKEKACEPGAQKHPLNLCSRCKCVWYCDASCQQQAYNVHKTVCMPVAELNNQPQEVKDRVNALRKACGITAFFKMNHPYIPPNALIPNDDEVVCQQRLANGTLVDVTQREFKELTGMTYVSGPLFDQRALIAALEKPLKDPRFPWRLNDAVAIQKHPITNWGLVAKQRIMPGKFLCSFGGEVVRKKDYDGVKASEKTREYTLRSQNNFHFDPSNYTALGGLVNDGLPNSRWAVFGFKDGYPDGVEVPFEVVFLATRVIEEGEPIYAFYGHNHGVGNRVCYHLDPSSFERLKKLFPSKLEAITEEQKAAYEYVIHRPYVLSKLHLIGPLDPRQTLADHPELGEKNRDAAAILKALCCIPKHERMAFAGILDEISQRAWMLLCVYLERYESTETAADWKKLGHAIERVAELFPAIALFPHQSENERKQFLDELVSERKIQMIREAERSTDLPQTLAQYYKDQKVRFLREFFAVLTLKENMSYCDSLASLASALGVKTRVSS